MGQAFGKSSAKQFYIRVSHIIAVDVTWSCSYLQAQQGEIFKKALLPGLQLDMTVSWDSGGAANWLSTHVASLAWQSQGSQGFYVVLKSKYPSCNPFYDLALEVTVLLLPYSIAQQKVTDSKGELDFIYWWRNVKFLEDCGTSILLQPSLEKYYLPQMVMGLIEIE